METGGVTLSCQLINLQNDAAFTVRVYVRSPHGWQSSPQETATATPKAFVLVQSLPVGTPINMTISGTKTLHYIANIGYENNSEVVVLIVKNAGNFNKSPYEVTAYLNNTLVNLYDKGSIIPSVNVIIETTGTYGCTRNDAVLKIFLPSVMEIAAPTNTGLSVGAQLQFFKNANLYKLLASSKGTSPTRNAGYNGMSIMYFFEPGTVKSYSVGGDLSVACPAIYAFCIPKSTKLHPIPNADGSYNLL